MLHTHANVQDVFFAPPGISYVFLDGGIGGGGHFEYRALVELAVIFERYIGAKFSLKWFRLLNQSRKKVGKQWSRNQKMTLLLVTGCKNINTTVHEHH